MTAVELLPPGQAIPDNEEWHKLRRAGISASEIAAVLGISPWESPFSLYWRKVNGWEVDQAPEMEWGSRLEDAIAAKFIDGHPDYAMALGGLEQHPVYSWMLATPDRLLWDTREPTLDITAVLELKTARSAQDGWGEPGTAQIPVHYRAQAQWQMAVTGVEVAHVAVLIAGSDYREYVVRADRKDIEVMFEAGRRFMNRHLWPGIPPPLDDHTATLPIVRQLHPDLDDSVKPVEVEPDLAAAYRRACRMAKLAEAVKKRREAQLRAVMGRARKATSGGLFVASRSIFTVAEHTVAEHTVDRLNPAREKKQ